ncbi:unnamed protein product [Cylicocyclus nassatus]|uniref:Uncharacterized protein n=1 Tax=Cylicocyclus nassatus TaxID=53992 RepID=A0AA36GC71_CYLNA|nr:unnamed protein product [Cylicocyclus nassatus]
MNRLAFIFPFLFFAIVPATVGIRKLPATTRKPQLTDYKACFATCSIALYQENKLNHTTRSVTCYKRCKKQQTKEEKEEFWQDMASLPKEKKGLIKKLIRSPRVK